ncbi:MAG: PepSY domain-containing protein [Gammaproteobacteria bacterium]|nr:PepSY domain-containing protein [Gammaproteobacteria bacterium]
MKRSGYLISGAALLAMLLSALPATAQYPGSGMAAGRASDLDQAVSRARKKGRVLSAETRDLQGRPTHFLRILTDDGRVRNLRLDAETGKPVRPRNRH